MCIVSTVDVAEEKVIWAMKKRKAVRKCLNEYFGKKPYRIVTGHDGNRTVEITEDPPNLLSIIVGEMLYQFRSALDHLFFELVKRNHGKGSRPPSWERRCQFPLKVNIPGGGNKTPVPRCKFKNKILNTLTDEAFEFIERAQPYYRPPLFRGERNRLLLLLTKLSNIDKHRYLSVTVLTVGHEQRASRKGGGSSVGLSPWLGHGAELEDYMHHPFPQGEAVEVTDKFEPQILFDEPEIGPPQTTPVHDVVLALPRFMLHWMVPKMKKLIENRA